MTRPPPPIGGGDLSPGHAHTYAAAAGDEGYSVKDEGASMRRWLPDVSVVRPDVLAPVLVVRWRGWVGAWSLPWLQ